MAGLQALAGSSVNPFPPPSDTPSKGPASGPPPPDALAPARPPLMGNSGSASARPCTCSPRRQGGSQEALAPSPPDVPRPCDHRPPGADFRPQPWEGLPEPPRGAVGRRKDLEQGPWGGQRTDRPRARLWIRPESLGLPRNEDADNPALSPAPTIRHPQPCTHSPAPTILHPVLHPESCTHSPAPTVLYPQPCTHNPAPTTLHPVLHPQSCTHSPAPIIQHPVLHPQG